MSEVQVTSHLRRTLHGRFDGQDYVFKPEDPVSIPRLAATHIFGLGQDNKTRALAQLGILKAGVTYQEALAVLRKVQFAEGHMVYEAQQQGPGGGQQNPQPGHQPGQHPGQKDQPDKEKKGPGKDEEHEEESEESGGTRPGAPKGPPGRKSEAEDPKFSASDDLSPAKRIW